MNKAIVFDLDGTLWDSRKQVSKCWENLGKKLFGDFFKMSSSFLESQMGKTMAEIENDIRDTYKLSEEQIKKFSSLAFDEEVKYLQRHPGVLYPNLIETIEDIKRKGYKVFICSNCQSGYIETFLNLLPEELFDDHICFGDTKQEKYISLLEILTRNCIDFAYFVGDTEKDYEAAMKAHVYFIHATYGFGKVNKCYASIDSLKDLSELF